MIAPPTVRIGPNALLQLAPVLDRAEGRAARLVHPAARARETACCAMGHSACQFEIRWR